MKRAKCMLAVLFLAAIMLPSQKVSAQLNRWSLGFDVSLGLPMGDYGKFTTYDNYALLWNKNAEGKTPTEGGALILFGADFRASYELGESLSLFGTVGLYLTGNDFSVSDSIVDYFVQQSIGIKHTSNNILNIPVMAGARYDLYLGSNFGLFAEAGIGLNIRTATELEFELRHYTPTLVIDDNGNYHGPYSNSVETYNMKPACNFAYELGVGLNINHSTSFGLYYLNLGSSAVKYEMSKEFSDVSCSPFSFEDDVEAGELTQSVLALRATFRF